MTLRTFTVFLWACLIATAAVAGEQHKMKIEIAVDDEGDHKVFEWHGDGTEIDDLAVGESKTITDDDGNEITLLRTDKGLEIEVDGEKIDLKGLHEDIDVLHERHGGEGIDVSVDKHRHVKVVRTAKSGGVTIISSDEIDAETRARIEDIFEEAGTDGTVMFIDGSELSGDEQAGTKREVRIIKEKIDVTN